MSIEKISLCRAFARGWWDFDRESTSDGLCRIEVVQVIRARSWVICAKVRRNRPLWSLLSRRKLAESRSRPRASSSLYENLKASETARLYRHLFHKKLNDIVHYNRRTLVSFSHYMRYSNENTFRSLEKRDTFARILGQINIYLKRHPELHYRLGIEYLSLILFRR